MILVDGNTRGGAMQSAVCVGGGATAVEPGKAPAEAGTCSITDNFIETGYCGLAQGQGVADVVIATTGGPVQRYTINYTTIITDGIRIRIGNFRKNFGPKIGDAQHIGRKTFVPSQTENCANKTQRAFVADGTWILTKPKTLP